MSNRKRKQSPFGIVLQRAIKEKFTVQNAFCAEAKFNESQLSSIIYGDIEFTDEHDKLFSEYLDLDAGYLIGVYNSEENVRFLEEHSRGGPNALAIFGDAADRDRITIETEHCKVTAPPHATLEQVRAHVTGALLGIQDALKGIDPPSNE